jgi:hypothetical protein
MTNFKIELVIPGKEVVLDTLEDAIAITDCITEFTYYIRVTAPNGKSKTFGFGLGNDWDDVRRWMGM